MPEQRPTFTTSNRGIAGLFVMNGHKARRIYRDDRNKVVLEFEKTAAIQELFNKWRNRTAVGNLADFNDAVFKINMAIKEEGI